VPDRLQHHPGQFRHDVKLADLMRDGAESGRDGERIPWLAIGGDGLDRQLPLGQASCKPLEKGLNVGLGRAWVSTW
jgi:hypothetical protein